MDGGGGSGGGRGGGDGETSVLEDAGEDIDEF